jgi:hypothetical protein
MVVLLVLGGWRTTYPPSEAFTPGDRFAAL